MEINFIKHNVTSLGLLLRMYLISLIVFHCQINATARIMTEILQLVPQITYILNQITYQLQLPHAVGNAVERFNFLKRYFIINVNSYKYFSDIIKMCVKH